MEGIGRELIVPGPGQIVLHNIRAGPGDPAGRLHVERADPRVLISEALLAQVRTGQGHPDLHLDGFTLVIDAANQRLTYQLSDFDAQSMCWLARRA